jgi:hypothetical protein
MAGDDIFRLRTFEYEDLRQRMYEGAPDSEWWVAVKTELDIRKAEKMGQHMAAMSEHTQRLQESINQLLSATDDMAQATKRTERAGKRLEWATYVILLATLAQVLLVVIPILRGH